MQWLSHQSNPSLRLLSKYTPFVPIYTPALHYLWFGLRYSGSGIIVVRNITRVYNFVYKAL